MAAPWASCETAGHSSPGTHQPPTSARIFPLYIPQKKRLRSSKQPTGDRPDRAARRTILQGTLDLDGAEDPRRDGADARLRHRAAHRADQRRRPAGEPGHHLSVPHPPGAEELDHGGVGHLGEQPQSEVLFDLEGRPEAARRRDRELGAGVRRHRPAAAARDQRSSHVEHACTRMAARVLALFRPGDLDRDLEQELESHLAHADRGQHPPRHDARTARPRGADSPGRAGRRSRSSIATSAACRASKPFCRICVSRSG